MSYEDFLAARRRLMAAVTRDAYHKLSTGKAEAVSPAPMPVGPAVEASLAELLDRELLRPGDLLDPLDPDWVVDAVINDDGELVIDGTHRFDSLDEAARHLDVTNISGLKFWALEEGDSLIPLVQLAS